MKLENGIEIVSLNKKIGQVRMQSRVRQGGVRYDARLPERVQERMRLISQWSTEQGGKSESFNFQRAGDVLPKEEDYIYVQFRTLSKTVVPGHWLDWTVDGVLEEGVSLLAGATVYPNHNFFDINNWLGSVNSAEWDAVGANCQGVPGISAEYKIDALMNPRIARGLLMKPPAIHSTSLTVLFEFEYSHQRLMDEGKFWVNLGEEIEGETVRLIVTKIREIWEASLVFQGADRLAKQAPTEEEGINRDGGDGRDKEEKAETRAADNLGRKQFSAAPVNAPTASALPANTSLTNSLSPASPVTTALTANNGHRSHQAKLSEITVNLAKETKAVLGIESENDNVSVAEILQAAEALHARQQETMREFQPEAIAALRREAATGTQLMQAKRTEVARLARLAKLGAEAGSLDEIISQQIEQADAETLIKLETYYQRRAANKFPASGRSSLESYEEIEAAGGIHRGDHKQPISVRELV